MKRAIVLLSGSHNDIGILVSAGIPVNPWVFIDCNSGSYGTQMIQTERLLCFVRDLRSPQNANTTNNTKNLRQVLQSLQNQFDEIIVGTHTYPEAPSVACDDAQLRHEFPRCQIVSYSTGLCEFKFVPNFCQELAKPQPNIRAIQRHFDKLFDELKKKHPLTLVRKLSILKHRIVHLFLPIDIDLQGLMETGFREDYWKEVADAWKGGKALGTLTEARKWVYGGEGVEDSVQKVVEDAKSSASEEHKNKIDCAWQKVQALLPNVNDQGVEDPVPAEGLQSLRQKYTEAKQILQELDKGEKSVVEQKCRNRSNPFHQWLAELDRALDELRDAIEQAQA
ncbi:MAG: hypothetical protein QXN89_03790 [Candidatus Woesearchaeota archaeon]